MHSLKRSLLVALGVAILPSGLVAQQKAPAPARAQAASPAAAPSMDDARGWVQELQQIQAKLKPAHDKAMQDPKLQAFRRELDAAVEAHIRAAEPKLVARAEAIDKAGLAAHKAGDAAKVQQLATEARQIAVELMGAQREALRAPAIAEKAEAFQQGLEVKMIAVEPATKPLIARYKELGERLQAAIASREQR